MLVRSKGKGEVKEYHKISDVDNCVDGEWWCFIKFGKTEHDTGVGVK